MAPTENKENGVDIKGLFGAKCLNLSSPPDDKRSAYETSADMKLTSEVSKNSRALASFLLVNNFHIYLLNQKVY